jgi:hypothetical protein
MKPVVTKADLNEALSQERAFLFLWVNWAIQARHSEIAVRKLLESWAREYPDCRAQAYRVDISDEETGGWELIAEWLRGAVQPQVLSSFGGNGELLWLRSGKVAAAVPYVARIEEGELIATTRTAFGV